MLSQRSKDRVVEDIRKFRATGVLPRDYDVRIANSSGWDEDNPGAAYIEPGPRQDIDPYGQVVHLDEHIDKEPFTSNAAEIFAANRPRFEFALSPNERRVFSLMMLGGMSGCETAQIMGITPQRVAQIVAAVRTKASKYSREGLRDILV